MPVDRAVAESGDTVLIYKGVAEVGPDYEGSVRSDLEVEHISFNKFWAEHKALHDVRFKLGREKGAERLKSLEMYQVELGDDFPGGAKHLLDEEELLEMNEVKSEGEIK